MKIDRSNYEIWLIDWLDGNLTAHQAEEVQLFLNQNADLNKDFEDLTTFSLKPSEKSFSGKSLLKKTTSEFTEKQFEFLCVASLENDLNPSLEAELKEIIDLNPEKKKTFELTQKMKLFPEDISYTHKDQLLKKTLIQKVIRLSAIGLTAAAAIALFLTIYQQIPQNLSKKSDKGLLSASAQPSKIDSSLKSSPKLVPPTIPSDKKLVVVKHNPEKLLASVPKKNIILPDSLSSSPISNDLLQGTPEEGMKITKILIPSQSGFPEMNLNKTLIASGNTGFNLPNNEERSNVGRFIAKNFREIFLKEKSPKDGPLKGYEIAEVGVTGLNKLLGWEMALEKNNDQNGELRSVYFSSKILKFNTPVKKSEPYQ
jgi:hypothetical protein